MFHKLEILQVLKFADVERKSQFSSKLKNFAEGIGAIFSTNNFAKAELIFNSATTKEDRQKLLDKFFRVICLQVKFLQEFGNPAIGNPAIVWNVFHKNQGIPSFL